MKNKSIKINAILNGLKQCCTLLFPLITIPYISRILGKENYGKINFGSSIIGYFTLVAALGIIAYAIREGSKVRKDREKFQQFANEIFTINIITTIISYTALFLFLIYWDKMLDYRLLIMIQALPIIFTTIGIDWTNNIFEDFFYTTVRYVVIQVISLLFMFLLVHEKSDYLIYAGITSIANIGGNIANILYIRKNYVKVRLVRHVNAKKHLKPMIYLFGITLANTIYVNADVTILTLLKDDATTGIYSIATKIYMIVKQFINAIIGVALPRLSTYLGGSNQEAYNSLLNKVLHAVLFLTLPSTVGLFMLSKNIIEFIAGPEYISGYIALRILTIALSFSVLCFFFIYSVMIPNRLEKYSLIYTMIGAVVNVSLNFVFIPWLSLNGAAITTVLSEMIVLGLSSYRTRNLYKITLTIKQLLPCIASCIGIGGICYLIQQMFDNNILIIIMSIVFSVAFYCSTMIVMNDEIVGATIVNIFNRIKIKIIKYKNKK